MREILALVPHRGDHRDSLRLRELDCPLLRLPDGALDRVVAAVEEIRIGEVAVVRHVDVVRRCPDERADHRFGKEEAGGVARLDSGDLDVRRHADDSESVGGGGDGSGGMGAVAVVVLCRKSGHRHSAHAVDAVGHVDVLPQVRMVEIDSRIDVAHQHRGAAAGDRMRFRCVDLPHVPLQRRERVRVRRWRIRKVAGRRPLRIHLRVG